MQQGLSHIVQFESLTQSSPVHPLLLSLPLVAVSRLCKLAIRRTPSQTLLLQVEIVNAFEGKDGLKAFKEWVNTPDKDILEEAQRVTKRGRGKKKEEPEEIPRESPSYLGSRISLFPRLQRGSLNTSDVFFRCCYFLID